MNGRTVVKSSSHADYLVQISTFLTFSIFPGCHQGAIPAEPQPGDEALLPLHARLALPLPLRRRTRLARRIRSRAALYLHVTRPVLEDAVELAGSEDER